MKKILLKCHGFRHYLFSILSLKPMIMLLIVSLNAFQIQADTVKRTDILSLSFQNAALKDIFKEIEEKTKYRFFYNTKVINETRKASITSFNAPIEAVVSALLSSYTDLSFRIRGDQIIIKSAKKENKILPPDISTDTVITEESNRERKGQLTLPPLYVKDEITVRGTITSETGDPMPGVNVIQKGTANGTTTDREGKYSLVVTEEDAVLVFSFIGYTTQEVAVNGQEVVDIALLVDVQYLGEVVVTALGIARDKKALVYSATEISGESFTKAREVNLGNALSGKIAGVNATRTATGPGGSSRVIIRGNGSLSGDNQPLYVVNGVPIDNRNLGSVGMWGGFDAGDGLNSIDPDNIESITVFKGGASAALYGSRAANGVILITTKTGKAQKGIGVEFTSTYTMETPLVYSDYQDQYGSGTRGVKPTSKAEAIENGTVSWGAQLDGSMGIQPDGVERPYSAQKNNIKNFYAVGHSFSNSMALSGGNESARFRFSASNMSDNAIIPNSKINRKIFSLDVSADLAKKIVFSANAQFNIEEAKNRPYVSDQPFNANSAPQLLATNIDIRTLLPGYDDQGYEPLWHVGDANNPYFIINKVKNNDKRNRLIGAFSARYNIKDYLYVRGRFGIDYYNVESEKIIPTGIQYWAPNMSSNSSINYETNVEGIIGFNKTFGQFSIDAFAGGNQMYNVTKGIGLSSGPFNVPFAYFIGNGKGQTFGLNFQERGINSLFAAADISYHNYLYLSFTARNDWFSTLPIKSNNILYPSAGLSFVFSDAWDSKPSWLSYGKIRSSWAQVGGGAPGPYSLNLTYSPISSQALGQPLMATGTVPNGSIKPNTSTTTELGIELKTLNNRLGADVTLYKRETTNDIVSASVSSTTGSGSVLLNVGEVQNRGIEILLSGSPVESKNGFKWDVSFNMAYNKSTIVKIAEAEGLTRLFLPGAEIRTKNAFIYHFQGMPYGQISGYKAKTDADGNVIYDKATGLPVKSDFMSLGNGVPPLTMGLTNSFNYRNFSFSFLLDGKFGGKLYSATNAYATRWGLAKRTVENNVRENGVTVSGVDLEGNPFSATMPAQDYFQGIWGSITNEFVYDASFVKLRQLVFGYSLPPSILSKSPFQSASLSLVARNLLLLYSKVPNIDPESTYNNSNGQGLEMYGVPSTRSYGFNLMVRF